MIYIYIHLFIFYEYISSDGLFNVCHYKAAEIFPPLRFSPILLIYQTYFSQTLLTCISHSSLLYAVSVYIFSLMLVLIYFPSISLILLINLRPFIPTLPIYDSHPFTNSCILLNCPSLCDDTAILTLFSMFINISWLCFI